MQGIFGVRVYIHILYILLMACHGSQYFAQHSFVGHSILLKTFFFLFYFYFLHIFACEFYARALLFLLAVFQLVMTHFSDSANVHCSL